MSASSMDNDLDDTDDAVELVRVPTPGMPFPGYSRLLKPSPTAKRTSRGIPIAMPTAERRETNFSTFIPSATQTGSRENGYQKKPIFGQSKPQHIARQRGQDSTETKKSTQSTGSLENRKKQKPQEVVLLSDEDDMKDPKTVKRKKHVQEADSHTSRSHAVESRAASVVSRMKKDTAPATPVVPETLPSYMDVDVEPKLALTSIPRSHFTTPAITQTTARVSTSTKPRSTAGKPASTSATTASSLPKLGSILERLVSSPTKLVQPTARPLSPSTTKPTSSITAPLPSTTNPVSLSKTPVSSPTKLFPISPAPTSPTSPILPTTLSSLKKKSTQSSPSLIEKSLQLGVGSFPHLPLDNVRIGSKVEFKRPNMGVQLGPDRFIINIDKNATKIPHETLKAVGYYIGGETQIIILCTSERLDSESILAPHYDPTSHSSKEKKMVLFSTSKEPSIEEYCDKLATMGYSTHKLTSESAEKYLSGSSNVQSPPETPITGTNTVIPHIPRHPDDIQPRQTLFMFPFKSTPKTRSIAVHIEDLSRLYESDFLNDILIEFGLKYVYEGLEKSNPTRAKRTYIFNSFFYQRLIAKPAAGMSAYDAVKSWTNKIDLFDMDVIVVPICERAHWYLAIITNPWLLLQERQDETMMSKGDISATTSSSSSPKGGSRNGSPFDSPTLPSVSESMESLTGSTKELLLKGEHGTDRSSKATTDDDTGRPRRVLRSSTTPVDVTTHPYIIVLDSLGGNHPTVFKALRLYLQHELLARKSIKRTLTINDITGKYAKPPQQQNFSDCGLYLLHYAEVFLRNPDVLLDEIVNRNPEHEKYWMAEELPNKRDYYRDVVVQLAEDYKVYLAEQQRLKQLGSSSTTSLQSSTKSSPDKTQN